jgi:hypothetical protein
MKEFKIFGLKYFCPEVLAFLALFIGDIISSILAITFLIFADTLTGIWASLKLNIPISSRKAGRITSKLIIYPLAIIVSKVAEVYLTPVLPWIQVTSGIIAIVEVKSVFENMSIILGYDLWEKIKLVLWKEREIAKKNLEEKE